MSFPRFLGLAATLISGCAVLSANAAPVSYTVDTVHSRVVFYVSHLGFSYSVGQFRLADSVVQFDNDDWSRSSVEVRLPVETLDLGDLKWQTHVLSPDFLESAKYPDIHFVSTGLQSSGNGQGKLHGELTIHGVTKPVVLELRLNKLGEHPMRKTPAIGFTATTVVKRSQFGVAAYVPAVADDLDVRIEVEAFVSPKE